MDHCSRDTFETVIVFITNGASCLLALWVSVNSLVLCIYESRVFIPLGALRYLFQRDLSHVLQLRHSCVQLLWIFESPPNILWHIPERVLKPLGIILSRILHLCHICHLPDEHGFNPAGIKPTYVTVGFWVTLSAVSQANHLPLWQPGVNLFHATSFICFRALSQRSEEAA